MWALLSSSLLSHPAIQTTRLYMTKCQFGGIQKKGNDVFPRVAFVK